MIKASGLVPSSPKTSTSATASASGSDRANVYNLQLELVEARRKISRLKTDHDRLSEEHRAFIAEHDKMKADFGGLLAKYGNPKLSDIVSTQCLKRGKIVFERCYFSSKTLHHFRTWTLRSQFVLLPNLTLNNNISPPPPPTPHPPTPPTPTPRLTTPSPHPAAAAGGPSNGLRSSPRSFPPFQTDDPAELRRMLASRNETVAGLRSKLFTKEFCLRAQIQYCAENHVDVGVVQAMIEQQHQQQLDE